MQNKPDRKELLKQAIYSVLIGTAISLLTIFFQFIVDWLNTIPAEVTGSVGGMVRYLVWAKLHLQG